MTMLDQMRAKSQLAQKAGVHVSEVKKMGIWGNHSSTQYPDFYNAEIKGNPADKVIEDQAWLKSDFLTTVQQRGAAIIKARGASSAASAGNAALETAKSLLTPTKEGEFFSVAVSTNVAKENGGDYGISSDLIYSYPVRSDGEGWQVVKDIKHNDFSTEKIVASEKELLSERAAVKDLLRNG